MNAARDGQHRGGVATICGKRVPWSTTVRNVFGIACWLKAIVGWSSDSITTMFGRAASRSAFALPGLAPEVDATAPIEASRSRARPGAGSSRMRLLVPVVIPLDAAAEPNRGSGS
jgi:hypothetical protein